MNWRRRRKNCRMKTFFAFLLACALAIPSFAQAAMTNTVTNATANAAPQPSSNQSAQVALTLPARAAVVSAPLIFTNGCISQPEQTELAGGGKAIFNFAVTNAGNYVIQAVVSAPAEDANSFYVNVDAQPEDPAMIWDIDVTSGFEERTVSWRGKGTAESDEIVPKRFNLSAGAHKLIIVGRDRRN